MEAKFTVGPWGARVSETGHSASVYDGSGERLASVFCGGTQGHARDNARLISAAPDLYAALELVLRYEMGLGVEDESLVWARDVGPVIMNALAKARGETP